MPAAVVVVVLDPPDGDPVVVVPVPLAVTVLLEECQLFVRILIHFEDIMLT